MALTDLYSPKQLKVMNFAVTHPFFLLINAGAKRSGKTVLDNDLFLLELKRVRQQADAMGISTPQYILAGADLSSIQRNVLNELSNKYGFTPKFDKYNRFNLFGVRVCCFGHSKINDLGRIRGMTAYGAYINEATVANEQVFSEIVSRCSAPGARLIMDTNPAAPSHWLKQHYCDKADGEKIAYFHWKLEDNTFLTDEYIENIKRATPSGMFYDRDILGAWVAANGIVYPDFDRSKHYITADQVPAIAYYFCGQDFGWEHPGVLHLFGKGVDDKTYLLREWCAKHRSIADWIRIAQEDIIPRTGNILFYCDSARPDLIDEMTKAGLRAIGARKDVVAGIAAVATAFKTDQLFVVRENVSEFDEEIDTYSWKDGTDEPVKNKDDSMDALRYGIYSDSWFGDR